MKRSYRQGKQTGAAKAVAWTGLLFFLCAAEAMAIAPAAKVFVKKSGFYRVSKEALAPIFSMTPDEVSRTEFIVSNLGLEVSSARENGDVIFYGRALENVYTDENVYIVERGVPSRMNELAVGPGTRAPYAPSFPCVVKAERQVSIRADIVVDPQAEYDDPILWRMFTSGLSTRQYNAPLILPGVVPNTGGSLTVRLKGATDVAGKYFHAASFELNGKNLGTNSFDGLQSVAFTMEVMRGAWGYSNTVRIVSVPPPGTTYDSFYLDYIEARYERAYAAQDDQLEMTVAPGSVQVTGWSGPDVWLWDVSDRWTARRITGGRVQENTGGYSIAFDVDEPATFAAVRVGAEYAPVRVVARSLMDLKSRAWEVDHLTIASPELKDAASALTAYRESRGLKAMIVSADDVYDAFNHGIRDARALKQMLAYAYYNWKVSPRYVVLVGDGSLDYKNSLGFNDSRVPSFPIVVPTGLYASDTPFGDVNNDGFADLAVGRIPVNTPEQVAQFVEKIVKYEAGGWWRTNTLITTDQSDYMGSFYSDGTIVEQNITEREVHRADVDILGVAAVRSKLLEGLNDGKEVSVYVGHGTANSLSLQSILLTSDTPALTNRSSPTAFIGAACLIGTFGNPGFTSIGEGIVTAEGGAAAMIASATMISAMDGLLMSERVVAEIYSNKVSRVGDAWISGKNRLASYGFRPAVQGYQFLGDPALAVWDPDAPRGEESAQPQTGTYEEWVKYTIPPAMQDLGVGLDPEDDLDGDGLSNEGEYLAGTDPLDSRSLLQITSIRRNPNGTFTVAWPSVHGRMYRLEGVGEARNTAYSTIADSVPATAPLNQLTFQDVGSNLRFYRVVIPSAAP